MIAHAPSTLLALLAQTSGPAGLLGNPILMMVVVMGIFYFLLILPQQRRQKQIRAMLQALKAGDKVITNGGIYGTIVGVEGDAVQLRVADQVKIKVARSAIASVQPEVKEN
ncbi:MAG: preprotein translocase subunit YajC [Candidatus Acidiferrales bacterium]|jgi:preprotein translocase subunit YajC